MIIFTIHALERIKSRRISRNDVISCIENPDRTLKLNGIFRAVKREDDKVLVAIYRKSNDDTVVITAYRSTKEGEIPLTARANGRNMLKGTRIAVEFILELLANG